jgi:hypothetical protein
MITPSLETVFVRSGAGAEMPIPAPLKPLTTPTSAPRSDKVSVPVEEPVEPAAETPAIEPAKTRPAPAEPRPAPESAPKAAPKAKAKPKPKPKPKPASEPEPEPIQEPTPEPAPAPRPATPRGGIGVDVAPDACILLIHIDVADVLEEPDHARLQQMLLAHAGWRVAGSATFGGGSAMAEQAIALIAESRWRAPPARVALLQDGSQPPITESLRFLRAVRAAAGEHAPILLALVGDPDGDDSLPPISGFDFSDWARKIEQMGDPYLRLEMLAGPAEDA